MLLNRLLDPRLESEILAALLIAALALLTGAIHYEGLQNTFDALSARISHGEQTGYGHAFGVLAIVFVVLLKVRAIEVTGETRSLGLLLTPVFARWSLVIFLYGSASAAEGTARTFADRRSSMASHLDNSRNPGASHFPGGTNSTLDWIIFVGFCFALPELSPQDEMAASPSTISAPLSNSVKP